MSPLIRPGISVLINDITDLDPNVNLLLGATLFYSAYPAAEGKAGIYAKWAGEGGAEQAIKGIPHGMAPRSPTWRLAVDVFKHRYCQFNPPHAGVTSVLIVPDTDTDVDKSQPRHPTSTAVNTDSTQADKTGLGDLMELLNTLPTHVLDSARRRNRPAASPVPSSAITLSAQQPQSAKPCVKSSASTTAAGGSVTTKAPNVAFAHGEASDNHTSASPHTTITHMASTTAAAVSPLPSTLFKRKASIGGSNANMPDTSRPSAPHTPSTVRAPTSGSRALIDSPLRGIGFAAFAAPKECYVLGYWTRAVLEFVHCDQEVIPIIESRLVHLSYDEDDVELQASLAEELTGELSHFVVNLLKLDAFLKSVGRYA